MASTAKDLKKKYTYGDYLKWSGQERWEIIDGIVHNMTPAPTPNHQRLAGEIFFWIKSYLRGKSCEVFMAPIDVLLFADGQNNEEQRTVVQPDVLIICDPSKINEKVCKGAPDLIIEILSPSTAKQDMIIKRELYERAGVKEYWIVDPYNKTVTVLTLVNKQFSRVDFYAEDGEIKVGIFDDLIINLKEVFGK